MNYLPYGENRSGTWTASALVSLVLHAALIMAMSSNLAQLVLKPRDELQRPDIQIRLEQTQTDLLADLQDRLRGLDDLPPPLAFDELAPEDAQDTLPGADAFQPEVPDDLDVAAADDADTPTVEEAEAPETFEAIEAAPEADIPAAEVESPDTLETALSADLQDDPPLAQDSAPEDLAKVADADIPAAEDPADDADAAVADAAPEAIDPAPTDDASVTEADIPPDQLPPAENATAAVIPAPDIVDDLSVPLPEDGATPPIATESPLFSEDGTGAVAPVDAGAVDSGVAPLPQLAQDVLEQTAPEPLPDLAIADVDTATSESDMLADAVGPEQVAILSLPDPDDAAPSDTAQPDPEAPADDPASPESADLPPDDTVAAVPVIPPPTERTVRRVPRTPPTSRDLAVADLIQRIQSNPAPDCLVALPRRVGADGIGLTLISAQDDARAEFANRLLTRPEDAEIRQTPMLIDPRQCPALGFVAANRDYPATRIGIRIERAEVPSGNRLSGTLTNVRQRNLTLFLVDNNGVVHNLDRFVAQQDGTLRFDVPVTRVGPRRDTKQLILAVASDDPLDQFSALSGQRAEDVFTNLSAALVRDVALAVLAFDVR